MTRLVACLLIVIFASPAAADIRGSVAREAALAAAPFLDGGQARPNARGQGGDNPYLIPAIALIGVGSVVALYGMTHETGVACSSNSASTSVSCGVTKSKATIFAGLGMVGVGTFLFVKGKKRSSSPELLIGYGTVGARQRLTW